MLEELDSIQSSIAGVVDQKQECSIYFGHICMVRNHIPME